MEYFRSLNREHKDILARTTVIMLHLFTPSSIKELEVEIKILYV